MNADSSRLFYPAARSCRRAHSAFGSALVSLALAGFVAGVVGCGAGGAPDDQKALVLALASFAAKPAAGGGPEPLAV